MGEWEQGGRMGVVQSVNSQLCNHEHLNSDAQYLHKKPSMAMGTCNSSTGTEEAEEDSWGLLTSQTMQIHESQAHNRHASKNKWRITEEDT